MSRRASRAAVMAALRPQTNRRLVLTMDVATMFPIGPIVSINKASSSCVPAFLSSESERREFMKVAGATLKRLNGYWR